MILSPRLNLFSCINNDIFFRLLEFYEALYPYSSTEPDDLCFEQNDIIKVIKKDGEWWTGVLRGKCGVFPSNYVQKTTYQVCKK